MKKESLRKSIKISIFILFPVFVMLGVIWLYGMNTYLTMDRKVDANVLVVEGWMPNCGLRRAYEEFQTGNYDYIISTGSRFDARITMHVNSYLIFYPNPQWKEQYRENQEQMFRLRTRSSLGKTDSAGFHFYVNDEMMGEFYTSQNDGRFTIPWVGAIGEIDSIMILYHNDKVGPEGDRNLIIERFTLNESQLNRKNVEMVFDRGRPFGRFRWDAGSVSYAEMALFYFLDRKVNQDIMFPVTNEFQNKRRTLGNALALKDWLDDQNLDIRGINVVSMDYHSRRTRKTYHMVLGDHLNVGIISAEDRCLDSVWGKGKTLLRESIAYIYYRIFVWPWYK